MVMDSAHHQERERGASAVEFAILSVVFLTLVFGMIQYSLYFWSTQSAANAARDAARRGAVGQTCADLAAQTANSTKLVESSFTVTRRYYGPHDTAFGAPIAAAPGANVRVVITYRTVNLHLPFIPMIHDARVKETAVARVENYSSITSGNWSSCG